jgi:YfiH family protein
MRAGKSHTIIHSEKFNPRSANGVIYFQFPSLSRHNGLFHGVFTRHGGVSKPPYDTLNTGYNTGDEFESVKENLRIIREALNTGRLVFMNQVHGDNVVSLHTGDHADLESIPAADGIITDIPDIAIMVKQADCQGVILADTVKEVVSIVHCGWRGSVRNILGAVVDRMKSEFKCNPSNMRAAIGPSLGPCCAEFLTYKEIFPRHFSPFMVGKNHFDLWGLSRSQLLEAGLDRDGIEIAGVCTKCHTDLFYSYRAEGTTGRFATVAMLREDG